MSVIKITKNGTVQGAVAENEIIRALAQDIAILKVAAITDLTDNSGGTAGANLQALSTSLANIAASGSSLAGKATTETALGKIKDALVELFTKANAYATPLGVSTVTYNGGGTAADGTVAALDVSVTGAATGALAANTNTIFNNLNNALYTLTVLTNKVAVALDLAPIPLGFAGTYSATVSTIATDTGTAADPGVTKVALDAELVKAAANVKLIATKLATFNTAKALQVRAV